MVKWFSRIISRGAIAIAGPDNSTQAASKFLAPMPAAVSTPEGDMAKVRLDHSPGKTNDVALFLPKGFDPSKPAILMPYFHGHGGGIQDAFERQKLAEIAAKSGKNIAFVIPQLGAKSDIKPEYRDPAYAQKFLNEAADALGGLYTKTHPGADGAQVSAEFHDMPVVPLSYSGGYQATLPNLKLPQVKGVVLLDSMYSNSSYFTDFTKRADAPFVSVTYGPSTADHTLDFAQHAAPGTAQVKPMAGTHADLVQHALGDALQTLSIQADNKVALAAPETKMAAVARLPRPAPTL